ncbi:MAG: ribonuclease R [Planctomycetota bacterium]
MSKSEIQNQIFEFVNQPGYRPMKPKQIAKHLGLEDDPADIRKVVKKMVKSGQLMYGEKHRVLPVAHTAKSSGAAPTRGDEKRVQGKFQRAAAGYGFIRPAGTSKADGRDHDIYVAEEDSSDAASGDVVIARLKKKRRGPSVRTVGEIIEIVERRTSQFVGTYFEDGGYGYVQVDGNEFHEPMFVGDPGAKNAKPSDKVVIEMVHYPKPGRQGEAVITEVLGKHGQPGVDTLLIIREFGLPDDFPEDALECAREAAAEFDETNLEGRRDLTNVPVLTIDPKDARDFDDAISLKQLENGHWQLGVHIADVSHFVKENSALDAEARNRATSVYLPDRVIPMIPEIISNNLASLQPERVRYAKTALIEFTEDGARVATDVFSSAIRSDRRFTYEEVDEYLDDPEDWRSKLTPEIHKLLEDMHTLAMILRERRMNAGSLELSMRDVKIDLDDKGAVAGAHRVENTVSHQIIEEFMLAANNAVAETMRDREIKFLRRIHGSPDPRRLKTLTEFVRHLGFEVDSLESRHEVKRLLAMVADQPEEYAINYAILRSFQKAIYSPEDEGHYALASDCYCHFTSPIRRYPDLTVHRLIDDIEARKTPSHEFGHLMFLGEHCSDREQRAEKSERELTKLKLLGFMKSQIGSKMEAVVTGVEVFGFFVMGLEIPAEGLVHINALEDDHYDYDDKTHAIYGRRGKRAFRLGDIVEVEIDRVDMDRRELDLKFLRHIKARQEGEGARPGGSSSLRKAKSKDRSGKGKSKGKGKNKGKGKRLMQPGFARNALAC